MVTAETFDQGLRPLVVNIVQEIRSLDPGIIESPTKSYLGLKIGASLVCAFFPDPYIASRRFFLGHWVPPRGGRNAQWVKPPIQSHADYDLLKERISSRIEFLRGRVRTQVSPETEKSHSWRIPHKVLVEEWIDSPFVEHLLVDEQIGAGGMGTVFLGRRFMTEGGLVAIKFLGTERRPTPQETARSKREVRLLAKELDHPNSPPVSFSDLPRTAQRRVVEQATARSPEDRFKSVQEFLVAAVSAWR